MQSSRATQSYRCGAFIQSRSTSPSSNPTLQIPNWFLFLPYFLHTLAASGSRMGKGRGSRGLPNRWSAKKQPPSGRNLPRYDPPHTRRAWKVPAFSCTSLDSDQALNPLINFPICSPSYGVKYGGIILQEVHSSRCAATRFVFPQKSPLEMPHNFTLFQISVRCQSLLCMYPSFS